MRKCQWSVAQAMCASPAVLNRWQSINWTRCEAEVRKLQVRIAKALKANAVPEEARSRLIRTRINSELREPCAVKVACTVLKGESGGNPAALLRKAKTADRFLLINSIWQV